MTSRRSLIAAAPGAVFVLLSGLLVVGVIDRGLALECHFCIGVNSCNVSSEEIQPVTCSYDVVRQTNQSLATFMPTLIYAPKTLDEEAFQCVHVRATSLTDRTFLFVRGCTYAMDSVEFCDIRHASFRGTRECLACGDEDLCNDVVISTTSGAAARGVSPGGQGVALSAALVMIIIGVGNYRLLHLR